MSKQYTLDKIENLSGSIKFNYNDAGIENPQYYIIRIEFYGRGLNGGASKCSEPTFLNVGSPQSTEYTAKEIYQKILQSMGSTIANKLKDLYIELIDEDISEE